MPHRLRERLDAEGMLVARLAALGHHDLPFVTRPFLAVHFALEDYTARTAMLLALDLGFETRLRRGCTVEELLEGLHPQSRFPIGWMLPFLADQGLLRAEGGRYFLDGTPDLDLAELRAFVEAEAPGQAVGFNLIDAVRSRVGPFFTEGRNGESLLFDLSVYPLWLEYFQDDNLAYAPNNLLALKALREELREGSRILELGGGAGSFAILFAREAAADGSLARVQEYRFTDLAPAFLRRAQRELSPKAPGLPLSFASLDINRPLDPQGLEGRRFDLITGINVLHVAKDLQPTLADLRAHLADGGRLIVGECLKPSLLRPIFTEYFFQFMRGYTEVNLDPVLRPVHGFLTADAWEANLRAAGFRTVEHRPDTRPIVGFFPNFYAGALVASD